MTNLTLYTSDGHAIKAQSDDIHRVICDLEEKHDSTPRSFSFNITLPFDKISAIMDLFSEPIYEVYEKRLPRKMKKRLKKIMFKQLGFMPKFRYIKTNKTTQP